MEATGTTEIAITATVPVQYFIPTAKIYKIVCGEYFYYGSCQTSLGKRKVNHRCRAKTYENKLYNYIKDKDWDIELVKEFPCNTVNELRQEEDKYVRQHLTSPFCLNERSATLDVEKEKARKKKWYDNNRDRILERARANYHRRRTVS